MSLTALIDADLVCFINAASAEGDHQKIAFLRADRQIRDILEYVNADKYQLYLSGGKNFRYSVNPQYKANRTAADPIHRKATHNFLISEWNAIETDGYEADDALGCNQGEGTVICSLDKDLLMIPGQHYSWPIVRKGKVLRDHTFHNVSYMEGIKHFYKQMLIGDNADNIIGVAKIGPVKAAKIVDELETEDDMKMVVRLLYSPVDPNNVEESMEEGTNRFNMNADCLWIMRTLGITYTLRGISD